MKLLFLVAAVVAVISAGMAITRKRPVHALLYLVVLLLAISAIFFLLGAMLAAVLEVIVYAGAVMVLFLFVVMMLNQGERTKEREQLLMEPVIWVGPVFLTAILFLEWLYVVMSRSDHVMGFQDVARTVFSKGFPVTIKEIGIALFETYGLGVELASMLLLSALVGSLHLSKRRQYLNINNGTSRLGEEEEIEEIEKIEEIEEIEGIKNIEDMGEGGELSIHKQDEEHIGEQKK